MPHYRLTLIVLAVFLLALAPPAWSCYTGLGVIPTADVVGDGVYVISPQLNGSLPTPKTDTLLLNTQVGIGNRFEAGLDVDLSEDADPTTFLNAKYVVATRNGCDQALAVGISGVAQGVKPVPYVVASGTLPAFRANLGGLRSDGRNRWFVGLDNDVSDKVNLSADYTSGEENYASIGVNYQFSEHLSAFAATLFPNAGGDTEFALYLNFTGSYRGEKAR